MDDRQFWLLVRQALLMFVDAIERRYGLKRTADTRKQEREEAYCIQGANAVK